MKETKQKKSLLPFFKDSYFWQPALSSLLLGLSRYPVKLNFLVFIAFIPLFILLNRKERLTFRKTIKIALSFSTVYTLVALYWISVVTLPGFIGLFILFGFYFILLFYAVRIVHNLLPIFTNIGFICLWLSFEWLQNFGELRFPWFNIGYSLADYVPLIQVAEIGGIYLLSLLILIVNVLLYSLWAQQSRLRKVISIFSALVILILWFGWGTYRLDNIHIVEKDFRAAIVQVSIPQYIKWDEAFYDTTLELYRDYTLQAAESQPDLIIWPESAIPDYVLKLQRPRNFVLNLVRETNIDLFLGLPHYEISHQNQEYELKFFNATTLIRGDGYIYDPYFKIFLVPVGERMPFMDYLPFLRNLHLGQANWEYGEEIIFYQTARNGEQYRFSSLICFEIAFPELTSKIAADGADFMINVTNDAWFKRTVGPYQHGMMTAIRAVETRTQIYRAANTGISMIVDPRGVIRHKTDLFEKVVIEDILFVYPGKTFFVRYMNGYPIIFVFFSALIFLISVIRGAFRKRIDRKA